MTPKARANALYYSSIPACFMGALALVLGREFSSDVMVGLGVTSIAGFVGLAGFGIATSRCPHCRRRIDLRGRSAFCVRCGQWIAAEEGEPAPLRS